MLFTNNRTARQATLLPLPLLLLATFLAFASSASALPTSNRRAAALFEPLFHAADPQVGPTRSIERLRLRRSLASLLRREEVAATAIAKKAEPIRNPKAKRAVAPSSSVVLNPKAKRSVVVATPVLNPKKRSTIVSAPVVLNPKKRSIIAPVVLNPKKRSIAVPVVLNPKKRSVLSASAPVILNPKKRSLAKRAPATTASIVVVPSTRLPTHRSAFLSLVRRILRGEQVDSAVEKRAINVKRAIPNPKNPNFSASCTSTVTVSSATPRTTTKAPAAT